MTVAEPLTEPQAPFTDPGVVLVRERAHNRGQMTRCLAVVGALGLVLASAACGSTRPTTVPDVREPAVVGMRLDEAEDVLEEAGFDVDAHSLDGGPIIVRHFWAVCRQSRTDASTVDLFVSHDCSLT